MDERQQLESMEYFTRMLLASFGISPTLPLTHKHSGLHGDLDLNCDETLSDAEPLVELECGEDLEDDWAASSGKFDFQGRKEREEPRTPKTRKRKAKPPIAKFSPPSRRDCSSTYSCSRSPDRNGYSYSELPNSFTCRRLRSPLIRRPSAKSPQQTKRTKSDGWKKPATKTLSGEALEKKINEALDTSHPDFAPGTRVWIKCCGFSEWPGIVWSLELCMKTQWPDILEAHSKGKVLVLFYGERMHMWALPSQLSILREISSARIERLKKWGQKNAKKKLIDMTLEDLENSSHNPEEEVRNIQADTIPTGRAAYISRCESCNDPGAVLFCGFCKKKFHTLCLSPPVLSMDHMPEDGSWTCPICGSDCMVGDAPEVPCEEMVEKTGLTPDWIIHAAAFKVFQLLKPTKEYPFIRGLLDPCTNSKKNPNIAAEKLYDKEDNGLKRSNSWEGYYVLLNPDFKSQVQWRFVNRAIDEVENQCVPAVVLICRNSTDTAYFQRLRPYPRVLLRRQSVKFKNYDHTPIGFGIVAFCIASGNCQDLYERFIDAFAPWGEPNIAVDRELLVTPDYHALLDRLREHAAVHERDHWIQCCKCEKWRIVSYALSQDFKDKEWKCEFLRPPHSNCGTPQTKAEIQGGKYVVGAEKCAAEDCGDDVMPISYPNDPCTSSTDITEGASTTQNRQWNTMDEMEKPALEVACPDTLRRLATLPQRSNASCMHLMQLGSGGAENLLTSLELARQARMAANRAYLKGIGKDPSAIHTGQVPAIPPNNDLVVFAAKEVAMKAAFADAQMKVKQAQRALEAKRRKRQIEESCLRKALQRKIKEEKAAIDELKSAREAMEQLTTKNIW